MNPITHTEVEVRNSSKEPLTRPGISSEKLTASGISQIDEVEAEKVCGIRASGIFLPYVGIDGNPIKDRGHRYGRLRLDEPV